MFSQIQGIIFLLLPLYLVVGKSQSDGKPLIDKSFIKL